MAVQQRATLEDVARLSGSAPRPSPACSRTASWSLPRRSSAFSRRRSDCASARTPSLAVSVEVGRRTRSASSWASSATRSTTRSRPASRRSSPAHGYALVVATTDDTPEGEERVADALLAQRIGALLLIPVADDQSYLEGERQLGTPVVAIDRPARNLVADSIVLENHRGVFDATTRLLAPRAPPDRLRLQPGIGLHAGRAPARVPRCAGGGYGIHDTARWERLVDDLDVPPDQRRRRSACERRCADGAHHRQQPHDDRRAAGAAGSRRRRAHRPRRVRRLRHRRRHRGHRDQLRPARAGSPRRARRDRAHRRPRADSPGRSSFRPGSSSAARASAAPTRGEDA